MFDLGTRKRWWIFGGVVTGVILMALNVATDEEELSILELMLDSVEIMLMVIGAGGVGMLLGRMHTEHNEKIALIKNLGIARTEGEAWRRKVQSQVAGIGAEMERQFEDWGLTSAEREVGLLMLKGLSHKEIAALRGTSEATVRQQARSVYHKSNLPGKTAFSAYFLEDLLPPTEEIRKFVPTRDSSFGDVGSSEVEPAPGYAMRVTGRDD